MLFKIKIGQNLFYLLLPHLCSINPICVIVCCSGSAHLTGQWDCARPQCCRTWRCESLLQRGTEELGDGWSTMPWAQRSVTVLFSLVTDGRDACCAPGLV